MPSRSAGFSLIELLVVVAIVAVLASLVLPAVGQVRAQARQVVCAGQLRQIGMAAMGYAGDHHGYFPRAFANPNTNFWIKNYSGEPNGLGALVPDHLDDARTIVCPGFNLVNGLGTFATTAAFAKRYAGYRYNGNPYEDVPSNSLNRFVVPGARNYIGGGWPLGLSRFAGSASANAARTVLAYDPITENTDPKGVQHPHPGDRITRRWGLIPLVKGGNVLYVDGRVEFLPGARWRAENGSQPNGSYYCPR